MVHVSLFAQSCSIYLNSPHIPSFCSLVLFALSFSSRPTNSLLGGCNLSKLILIHPPPTATRNTITISRRVPRWVFPRAMKRRYKNYDCVRVSVLWDCFDCLDRIPKCCTRMINMAMTINMVGLRQCRVRGKVQRLNRPRHEGTVATTTIPNPPLPSSMMDCNILPIDPPRPRRIDMEPRP